MNEFKINDYILNHEAESLAEQAKREAQEYGGDINDLLHEAVDGHEWVIYTYKALILCAECDTSEGEQWIEGTGQTFTDIGDHACAVAGATLYSAIYEAIEAIHGGTQRL